MNILLYFILGVIFVSFIQPLCDSILSLILTGIEALKAKISIKIAQYNEKIHKSQNLDDMRQIGFVCEEDAND